MAVQEQPKERMCPQCFEINPAGATFCQLCGAALTAAKDPAGEGSDTEVYRELAQTNLFRMRGAYKDAIQSCLGILKKYPNNATAHTLLGDIHAEMGELQQAAEWYEMALDLNPKSDGDKKKLASVKARILDRERAQTAEQIGLDTQKGPPKTSLYIGVMVALIVVVGGGAYALGAYFSGAGKAKPPVSKTVSVAPPPTTSRDSSDGDKPSPEPGGAPAPGASAPSASPLAPGPDRTALDFLRAQGRNSGKAINLTEDPRTGLVIVTAELDPVLGAQAQAALLAVDVLTVMPNSTTATVRLVQNSQTVLVADVTKAAWEQAKGTLQDGQTAADIAGTLLTNPWPAAAAGS